MRVDVRSYLCTVCFPLLTSFTENSLSNEVVCVCLIFSLIVSSSALVLRLLPLSTNTCRLTLCPSAAALAIRQVLRTTSSLPTCTRRRRPAPPLVFCFVTIH